MGTIVAAMLALPGAAASRSSPTRVHLTRWSVVVGAAHARHSVRLGRSYTHCIRNEVKALYVVVTPALRRRHGVKEAWKLNGKALGRRKGRNRIQVVSFGLRDAKGFPNGVWSVRIEVSRRVVRLARVKIKSRRCPPAAVGGGSGAAPVGGTPAGGLPASGPIPANFYVSQAATGNGSGSSCSDTLPYSWFNDSANWGTGAGEIGPGMVVGLCGTISSGLTMRGSGTSGNPITIAWEPGATMAAPTWSTAPNNAAISTDNNSYLTFNGGNNGVSIQATQEGTGRAYQGVDNTGIWAGGSTSGDECNNCTFENLTIANLYVHTSPADQSLSAGQVCAICWAGSNVTIANNTIHDGLWVLQGAWHNGDSNNYIYGNNVYNADHDLVAAPVHGATVSGIYVYDNHFHDYANWDTGNADVYHHDGIHCFGDTTDIYHGFYVFDNRFDGTEGSNATGQIFMEGNTGTPCSGVGSSIYLFNNVVTSSDNPPGNNYMGTAAIQGGIFNNTVVGTGNGGGCAGYGYEVPGQTVAFENNVMASCEDLVNNSGGGSASTPGGVFTAGSPDYNVYVNGGDLAFSANSCNFNFSQFSSWQTCLKATGTAPGYDQHSIAISSAQANLNSDLSPGAGSRVLGAGANLTGVCNSLSASAIPLWSGGAGRALCTTYTGPPLGGGAGSSTAGVARSSSGAWSAGAY